LVEQRKVLESEEGGSKLDFLIAPAVVAIIAGVLAAAISIVDKIVNNYGEVNISINDGKKVLTFDGGDSLLSSLAHRKSLYLLPVVEGVAVELANVRLPVMLVSICQQKYPIWKKRRWMKISVYPAR